MLISWKTQLGRAIVQLHHAVYRIHYIPDNFVSYGMWDAYFFSLFAQTVIVVSYEMCNK